MDLKPGRDPIIRNQEVVEEYKNMSRTYDHSENQQSSSLDDKIKEAQQCYKPFSTKEERLEESKEDEYNIASPSDAKLLHNYMDHEFKDIEDHDSSEHNYSHVEEARYGDFERKMRKQSHQNNIEEEEY